MSLTVSILAIASGTALAGWLLFAEANVGYPVTSSKGSIEVAVSDPLVEATVTRRFRSGLAEGLGEAPTDGLPVRETEMLVTFKHPKGWSGPTELSYALVFFGSTKPDWQQTEDPYGEGDAPRHFKDVTGMVTYGDGEGGLDQQVDALVGTLTLMNKPHSDEVGFSLLVLMSSRAPEIEVEGAHTEVLIPSIGGIGTSFLNFLREEEPLHHFPGLVQNTTAQRPQFRADKFPGHWHPPAALRVDTTVGEVPPTANIEFVSPPLEDPGQLRWSTPNAIRYVLRSAPAARRIERNLFVAGILTGIGAALAMEALFRLRPLRSELV